MSQALIRAALETPLATWAAAQSPAIPVAWENVTFQPGERYIRANLLPAQTISLDLLGKHRRYQGLLQITLVLPQGPGMGDAEELVSSLEALYPQHAIFTAAGLGVQIVRPMSAASGIPGDGDVSVPVTCRYQVDIVVP